MSGRTELGEFIHKILVGRTTEKLKKEGYEVQNPTALKLMGIDLIGKKGKERIGFVCLVKSGEKIVNRIMEKTSNMFDKIIFVVPAYSAYKPKSSWVIDVLSEMKK